VERNLRTSSHRVGILFLRLLLSLLRLLVASLLRLCNGDLSQHGGK
jgi:hypothetical protein